MVRDIARIDFILEQLRILWHQNPDQRLGQLLTNVLDHERTGAPAHPTSVWFVEDDWWSKKLIDYTLHTKPRIEV